VPALWNLSGGTRQEHATGAHAGRVRDRPHPKRWRLSLLQKRAFPLSMSTWACSRAPALLTARNRWSIYPGHRDAVSARDADAGASDRGAEQSSDRSSTYLPDRQSRAPGSERSSPRRGRRTPQPGHTDRPSRWSDGAIGGWAVGRRHHRCGRIPIRVQNARIARGCTHSSQETWWTMDGGMVGEVTSGWSPTAVLVQ
jgi:hypothetical protein